MILRLRNRRICTCPGFPGSRRAVLAARAAFSVALVCAPFTPQAAAQEILATVNGKPITAEEFRLRYALTVFPYKDVERLGEVVRRQFLYSIIAEKLLAADARRRGYEAEEWFRKSYRIAEEMFVRDKLYRDRIRAAVAVTPEDVRRRFSERRRAMECQFLYSASETEIRNLESLLRVGVPFDSLLAARQERDGFPLDAADPSVDALEPELRRAADALKPGGVSAPVTVYGGYYLLRKLSYGVGAQSEADLEQSRLSIEAELRREREASGTRTFMAKLWRGRKAEIDPLAYRDIGAFFQSVLKRQARADTSEIISPSPEDFDTLRLRLGQGLLAPFARIGTQALATGDFLDRLQSTGLRMRRADARKFPGIFKRAVNEQIDRFLITSEGYRLNLHMTEEVRRDLALWADHGLAQTLPDILWEQFIASDDSVWNYYVRHASLFGPPVEVKIYQALSRDSSIIREVERRFQAGASLPGSVAGFFGVANPPATGIETDYFPVTERGIIGRTAFGMAIADAAGPLETPDGFVFFQLLDKRRPRGAALRTPGEVREHVASYRAGILKRKCADVVTGLARAAHITIDEEALRRLHAESLQMFTIRFLGFGGRIPAAPAVMPLGDAVIEGMSTRAGDRQ